MGHFNALSPGTSTNDNKVSCLQISTTAIVVLLVLNVPVFHDR